MAALQPHPPATSPPGLTPRELPAAQQVNLSPSGSEGKEGLRQGANSGQRSRSGQRSPSGSEEAEALSHSQAAGIRLKDSRGDVCTGARGSCQGASSAFRQRASSGSSGDKREDGHEQDISKWGERTTSEEDAPERTPVDRPGRAPPRGEEAMGDHSAKASTSGQRQGSSSGQQQGTSSGSGHQRPGSISGPRQGASSGRRKGASAGRRRKPKPNPHDWEQWWRWRWDWQAGKWKTKGKRVGPREGGSNCEEGLHTESNKTAKKRKAKAKVRRELQDIVDPQGVPARRSSRERRHLENLLLHQELWRQRWEWREACALK